MGRDHRVHRASLLCLVYFMKLSYSEVKEARDLYYSGVLLENLGTIFEVSSMTMARYIRAYEKYGKSFWSPYPTEVEDARPET
jgi:hypothetical protein